MSKCELNSRYMAGRVPWEGVQTDNGWGALRAWRGMRKGQKSTWRRSGLGLEIGLELTKGLVRMQF
jgi:hypothetical protein